MSSREAFKGLETNHGNEIKYAYRSDITEAKIRQIVKLFAVDLDALKVR